MRTTYISPVSNENECERRTLLPCSQYRCPDRLAGPAPWSPPGSGYTASSYTQYGCGLEFGQKMTSATLANSIAQIYVNKKYSLACPF
jgi:hypothetical protein